MTILQKPFVLMLPLLLVACLGAKEVEWRQKLTLHLATPDGRAAFSSVTAIRCEAGYALDINGIKVTCREKGEAIVAKLGDRYLFVLLDGVNVGYRGAFREMREGSDYKPYWRQIRRSDGKVFDVPRARYPMFVSFEDLDDPTSVFEVNPDDLAEVFGEGYVVTSLTIEITRDPWVSNQVQTVLGWLRDLPPNQLDGSRFATTGASLRFANSLSPYSFSTEL